MKLIKHTYLATFLWLIPVLMAGSIFSFYMIKYIIYEETDEHLSYEMGRLIEFHANNADLPEFHKIAGIIENKKLVNPVFKDTMLLEVRDNEMIPHRELYFSINHEGRYFTLVLRQIMPGNDDIIEGTLLMMLGLFLLISLFLFIIVNIISGKLWSPFYKTLSVLSKYKITESVPHFPKSGVDEFNSLNRTIGELLHKIAYDYLRTKEFNENASHELQTHLSIIRLNAEKLLDTCRTDDKSLVYLQSITDAAAKLSAAQKSLLMLSKIGNLEYNKNTNLNLAEVFRNSLTLFQEAIGIRSIEVRLSLNDCVLFMDAGLAEILVNNLIKNAVKHNLQNGYISVKLTPDCLMIENTGSAFQHNPVSLFERFATGETGNLGLGLAIVKQICEVYNYHIAYEIVENVHRIQISFPET